MEIHMYCVANFLTISELKFLTPLSLSLPPSHLTGIVSVLTTTKIEPVIYGYVLTLAFDFLSALIVPLVPEALLKVNLDGSVCKNQMKRDYSPHCRHEQTCPCLDEAKGCQI